MSSPVKPNPDQSSIAIRLLLLATMATWGLNLSAVKALASSFDVLTLASVRMVVAVFTLTTLVLMRFRRLPSFSSKELVGVAFCGALMVYANQILFSAGLGRTSATNAALIVALGPIVSASLAGVLFREPMQPTRLAGITIGLAGVMLVILNRPGAALGQGSLGDLIMLCSVVCFASGGLTVQKIATRTDPLAISWAAHVFGAILLVVHTALSAEPSVTQIANSGGRAWGLVLFSGVMATGFAAAIWNRSIASIGASRTALAFYWVPIFGVAFAALALGETVTLWHLAGLGTVLAGSYLGSK